MKKWCGGGDDCVWNMKQVGGVDWCSRTGHIIRHVWSVLFPTCDVVNKLEESKQLVGRFFWNVGPGLGGFCFIDRKRRIVFQYYVSVEFVRDVSHFFLLLSHGQWKGYWLSRVFAPEVDDGLMLQHDIDHKFCMYWEGVIF